MARRILLVEDNPIQAEHVRLLLESQGYQVQLVANGREGLQQVQSAAPDLIMSDVGLPEMDGYAFCRAVKSAEATRQIPFVLLTKRKAPMDIVHGLEMGADNFITKPFDDGYLLERVRRIFVHLEFRQQGHLDVEVVLHMGDRQIVVNTDKQQIIELLFASLEELERMNVQLAESQRTVEGHASELEARVEERTQQLREAEAKHRVLVEQLPVVTYSSALDGVGSTLYVSPQIEGLLGFSQADWMTDPELWSRQLHGEERQRVLTEYAHACASGISFRSEYRMHARDGRVVWVYDEGVLVRDETGSPKFIHGAMLDITERKRIEAALRASEDRLRATFARAAVGMAITDLKGRFLQVNPAYCAITGYTEPEMTATDCPSITHPDDLEANMRLISQLLAGEAPSFVIEKRVITKSHAIAWVRNSVSLMRDAEGRPMNIIELAEDVTERKWAEDALQALYRASLQVQESMGLNERLECLLGTARDVLGLDRLHILLADSTRQWLQGVAALGVKEPAEMLRVPIGPEGGGIAQAYLSQQPVVWLDSCAPVPDSIRVQPPHNGLEAFRSRAFVLLPLVVQGRAIGVMGADRKHSRRPLELDLLPLLQLFAAQAAVAIQNARLFEQVQAGRERLRNLSNRLVTVQEAERRHLARELHDHIGQILTGLKLVLEMGARLPATRVEASLDEAKMVIGELMARVRDLSLDLRPAMLDDLGLLPALLWHFERYTAQTRVRVALEHCDVDRRFGPEIETAVYRIVQEALTNVVRHAGVSEITVRLWADQHALRLQVEDHGTGFDPEVALAGGGTSGLTGMRERAQLLGGKLTIESAPGAGACLTAELPLGDLIERRGVAR